MSDRKTNAQVALECATAYYSARAASNKYDSTRFWDITEWADEFKKWLDQNTEVSLEK